MVNGPDGMSRLLKMVLISSSGWVIIGSFPSKFLKSSYHLLRQSCLLFPLMMPFFAIVLPASYSLVASLICAGLCGELILLSVPCQQSLLLAPCCTILAKIVSVIEVIAHYWK